MNGVPDVGFETKTRIHNECG